MGNEVNRCFVEGFGGIPPRARKVLREVKKCNHDFSTREMLVTAVAQAYDQPLFAGLACATTHGTSPRRTVGLHRTASTSAPNQSGRRHPTTAVLASPRRRCLSS